MRILTWDYQFIILYFLQSNCWLYIDTYKFIFYFLGTNAWVFLDIPENLLADALLADRLTDVMGPFWEPEEKLFALVTGLGIFDFFTCPGGLVFDWVSALIFDNIDATVLGADFVLFWATEVVTFAPLLVEDLWSFVVLDWKKWFQWKLFVAAWLRLQTML